ncbi:hypothetical protein EMCRGX_G020979 [Ephydatia muelleri]
MFCRVSQPYFANVSRETPQGCSPHDTLHSAMSDDIFQTMTTTAVLTIAKSKLVGTSFFVVVMLVNDSFCFNTLEYGANEDLKTLEIIIQPTSPASHFLGPIIGSAAVIIGIGLFIILVYCLYFHMATRCRCAVIGETRRDQKGCCCNKCCPGCCSFWLLWCLVDYCCLLSSEIVLPRGQCCELELLSQVHLILMMVSHASTDAASSFTVPSASAVHIEEVVIVIATNMLCCDISSTIVKDESQLTVTHLTRNDYQQQQMQYATYAWNTMTVGIYYGIPALQLVLSQQSATLCEKQTKVSVDSLVLRCIKRNTSLMFRKLKGSAGSNELQGLPGSGNQNFRTDSMTLDYVTVPQHVGVYYAMGFALAMQGVMSGMYHICPNQTSFQFASGGQTDCNISLQLYHCIHSETGFGPFLVVGGCALVFLGLALNHFKQSTYSSDLTPAESREMNRPCIWLGFYGNHDVWHFYSALAVFFTLLALLVMDDGLTLANKPLPKIPVF